jgi:spore coat polysaccharide biosynthesis predicted glycosyltransferase SpsG
VDSRGIIINDIYKSPSEFFKKVSGLGLKFIYFDTCNSVQVVSAFRHTDISALIAAIQNLEVNYANRFELNFYQALGNGKTISEAFQQAAFSQHRDRLSQGADFFTRSGCYDPMFLDLKEDFRFGEEY